MFLDAISKLKSGIYAGIDISTELVYVIDSPVGLKVNFFAKNVILVKDTQTVTIGYDELSSGIIKQSDEMIFITFNGKKISYKSASSEKTKNELDFLQSLKQAFADGNLSSPYESVRNICEENGVFFDGKYNKYLYHFVLEYSNFFNNIVENDIIKENSSIEYLLEEHTAGLFDDTSGTIANLAKGLLSGNITGVAFAAGKKMLSSVANGFIGNNGILVVTNQNVIYAKGQNSFVIAEDLDQGLDNLEVQRDTTISGALDIYYEGEKILDNVATKLWSGYKAIIRKLKNQDSCNQPEKESEQYFISDDSSVSKDESSIDAIEDSLIRLKNLVEKGFISPDDYEKKKNEILGIKT